MNFSRKREYWVVDFGPTTKHESDYRYEITARNPSELYSWVDFEKHGPFTSLYKAKRVIQKRLAAERKANLENLRYVNAVKLSHFQKKVSYGKE